MMAFEAPPASHDSLDAYELARRALIAGHAIAKDMPGAYATLADQLRRALVSAFLQVTHATTRADARRLTRYRSAGRQASEAAAVLEAAMLLGLTPRDQVDPVLHLLGRLYALLTRLAREENA